MAQISSGKVSYGRTVKTGDFESKRCDVELAFSVGEGEDFQAYFDLTCRQVIRRFNEMTGLKDTIPDFAGVVETAKAPCTDAKADPTPAKAKREVGANLPGKTIEEAAAEDKPAKRGPGRPKGAKTKDEPEVADEKQAKEYAAQTLKAIDKAEGKAEPEVEPVTDAQLREACQKAATKIGPDKVKAIRNTFKVLQIIELEQGKRPAFLKALEEAHNEPATVDDI